MKFNREELEGFYDVNGEELLDVEVLNIIGLIICYYQINGFIWVSDLKNFIKRNMQIEISEDELNKIIKLYFEKRIGDDDGNYL
jgi:hypothetical protein